MVAEAHVLTDALRYFVLGEGLALIVIGLWSLWDAWKHTWPARYRWGLMLRWMGRVMIVAFASVFVVHRLHDPLNWYSPMVCAAFTMSLVGIVLSYKTIAVHFGEDV